MTPLSIDQQRVYNAICEFIQSDKQVFILYGSAGTGKTTLLAHVVEHIYNISRSFQLMAPTGRAAHILKQKTKAPASTIHRGIYDLEKLEVQLTEDDLAKSDFKFHYPIRVTDTTPICIVDEGSMIGNRYSEGELWTFGTNHLLDDLLTFAKLNDGGKLIIIGDPMQLPPVMEPISLAMQPSFYETQGIKVTSEQLTEIFRQDSNSAILQSAERMRITMQEGEYTHISMAEGEEITTLHSVDVPERYLQLFPEPKLGNSVVICYSNSTANHYNERIRQLMYGEQAAHLQLNDIMMVVNNCYDHTPPEENLNAGYRDIMNGEFVQVLEFSNEEVRTIPVYENGQRIHLSVTFVDVVLLLMSGEIHHCKMITEPILSAPRGTVSVTLIKALYIDFCMRNPQLRKNPKSEEFRNAIKTDPYINALRVRYGYAITGHKSQGGEWDIVFVDYSGVAYNEIGMRWMYTATTRARQHLYMANFVNVTPTYRLHLQDIVVAARKSEHYPLPLENRVGDTPFHDDSHPKYLISKYLEMHAALQDSTYTITRIEHLPYRERYTITAAHGQTYQVDCMYNKQGDFRPVNMLTANEELAALLNQQATHAVAYPPLEYEPSNNSMQYLFDTMSAACDRTQVEILKVVENLNHYQVIYCLRTSSAFAWITFFVSAKGFITYGVPHTADSNDDRLLTLLADLQT